MSARALVIDDHPIVLNALTASLLSLKVFDEVEAVKSLQELIAKLEQDAAYTLLILDLSLVDTAGAKGVAYLREHYPDIPVLIFSANESTDIIAECFEHGAQGFVCKKSSMQVFVTAIRVVLAGGIYIPPEVAQRLGFEAKEAAEPAQEQEESVRFTPKQRAVFQQLMLGVPNKVIARRLDMAEGTVKTHLHGIYQLLGVHNRARAILRAQQLLILD